MPIPTLNYRSILLIVIIIIVIISKRLHIPTIADALSHRKICRPPFLMARLLLLMDRHAALRSIALQALASGPEIFNGLLATHVGARHPVAASLDVAALGVRLLAGAAARRGSVAR